VGFKYPAYAGGWVLPDRGGTEDSDELARELYEVVNPKLYFNYDRHSDSYLSMPV
jgi:hypothetical protein